MTENVWSTTVDHAPMEKLVRNAPNGGIILETGERKRKRDFCRDLYL